MKTFIIFILLLPNLAMAAMLNCDFIFYGAPAGTVRMEVSAEGNPADHASVALFQTPAKDAPVTPVIPKHGDFLNVIFFKDDPQNEIHMKVQLPAADGGSMKSKLINPSMSGPTREIPGTCKF
ncbi:hypothetical protein DOM22_09780 [Bdellovibrio sp. ZAP7]|uniref:hypothetical protein n=1 Tax=Bdellovibrio sp. ZAP7 TaxID=2231053 RepID=UPI00115882A1|nr:hypothetical protein [Bdellovibrio sp. ZAP7]QDK45418.1 hypothetical protein DOM22_09780 [Bdellovibrio sp. ZAP7]